MHRFWAVFEGRDGLNPHSAPERPFSEKRKQSRFFLGLIQFFRYPVSFFPIALLRGTKRDIGKIKRAIVQIKREIISTKRALVATKRDLGGTPSPLSRGGSAASWDKIVYGNQYKRGIREGFREAFLFTLALNVRESGK